MYYVWKQDLTLEDDFATFTNEPDAFDPQLWTSAEELDAPPSFDLADDSDSPTTLSDVLLTSFPLQVFSPKLKSLLRDIGVRNIQYFPIAISGREDREEVTAHQIANIVGAIDCLDFDHSRYARSQGDGSIIRVSKFRIRPDAVKWSASDGTVPLLFRLGEFKRHILVHESVKDACQKAGITGVKFVPPEAYV
jgi:hypothetical protein